MMSVSSGSVHSRLLSPHLSVDEPAAAWVSGSQAEEGRGKGGGEDERRLEKDRKEFLLGGISCVSQYESVCWQRV